jgi:hypothetical protein
MDFDPYNQFLKFRKSVVTPTPKVGAHLGVWRFIPSQSPTLSHTLGSMECDSRASFLARTFASPCFDCEPKIRVMTFFHHQAHCQLWIQFKDYYV